MCISFGNLDSARMSSEGYGVSESHFTSGASVRPENTVTCSAGNGGQTFVGFSLKPLHCRDPALLLESHMYGRPFLQLSIPSRVS